MIVVYLINRIYTIKSILEFMGKHTLELYVANCVIMVLVRTIDMLWQKLLLYWGGTIGIAIILYFLDMQIQNAILLNTNKNVDTH